VGRILIGCQCLYHSSAENKQKYIFLIDSSDSVVIILVVVYNDFYNYW